MDFLDYPAIADLTPLTSVTGSIDLDVSQNLAPCDDSPAPALGEAYASAPFFDLENYAVLEQFQDFYLLQNPQTALFYIWATADELPIFKSISWPVAYRTWLGLRQNQSQNRTKSTPKDALTQDLQEWVNCHPDHPQFGQLVYRRDRHCEDFLQYAVQLSDQVALRWTAGNSAGELVLEPISRRQHRPAKWVEPQSRSRIAAALYCAIKIFHQRWAYSPYRFNSEHWARLIVTGHCGSFQRDEILSFWEKSSSTDEREITLPEILEFNLEAEFLLNAAIAAHQASLKDAPQPFPPKS